MDKKHEYANTLKQFAEEGKVKRWYDLQEILDKLHYYETALYHLAETACNRELTAHEEKRQASITAKVKAIAEQIGFKVKFNRDPLGCAIRFILPSGDSNNWDGETWGIYW